MIDGKNNLDSSNTDIYEVKSGTYSIDPNDRPGWIPYFEYGVLIVRTPSRTNNRYAMKSFIFITTDNNFYYSISWNGSIHSNWKKLNQ